MTIENCGRQVTIKKPPERVVLIGDNAVTLLAAAGALGKVVGLAAEPPLEIYDAATRAAVEKIKPIGAGESASGSVQVSLEQVIAEKPDFVIGNNSREAGATPDAMDGVGIPNIVLPSFCPDAAKGLHNPGFADVYSQIELYAVSMVSGVLVRKQAVFVLQCTLTPVWCRLFVAPKTELAHSGDASRGRVPVWRSARPWGQVENARSDTSQAGV